MSAGITRINGVVTLPTQRPSTLSFYQITFAATVAAEVTSGKVLVDGAIDRTLRACANFATVGMIGTLQTTGTTLVIGLEDTGIDAVTPTGLGIGNSGTPATTAAALQVAIRALGTVNGFALGSASVAAFTL